MKATLLYAMKSVVERECNASNFARLSRGRRRVFRVLTALGVGVLTGCGDRFGGGVGRPRKSDITMAPQFVLSHQPVVPVLLEVDFTGVQLASVDNIFSPDPVDRSYALYFALTQSAASTLSTVTQKHVGKKLYLMASGQQLGVHPIDRPVTNGVLPVLLTGKKMNEDRARFIHSHLERSLAAIQYFHAKG